MVRVMAIQGIGRLRRGVACAALVVLVCLLAPVAVGAQAPGDEGRVGAVIGDGHDALGLRLALLCFVGLALAGGAYKQYQTISATRRDAPRGGQPSRTRPAARAGGAAVERPTAATREAVPLEMPRGVAPARQAPPLRAVAAAPTPAEERCARAIAAAHQYDRRTTLAAFRSALASDPNAKPSALPGFWEMPSGGHADLARVYLERRQGLDARSVLTVAMMLFPHNRELELLAREAEVDRRSSRTA